MGRSNKVKVQSLTKECFEKHPVWSWDGSQEFHVPVLKTDPLPENFGTLFIKSDFYTPNRYKLQGYVIGLESFYAICIFAGDKEFNFNLNLPEMAKNDLISLFESFGKKPFKVFPLSYTTEFRFTGCDRIFGVFDPFN